MKAVDTTGAGDAFVSGLLNSLASDLTLLTVLTYLSLRFFSFHLSSSMACELRYVHFVKCAG